MVSAGILAQPSNHSSSSDSEEDTVSTASFDGTVVPHGDDGTVVPHDDDDDTVAAAIAPRDEAPVFGSISVINSNDIHFGNKTVYQGPVTIKQFLYANGANKTIDDGDVVIDERGAVTTTFAGDKVCFNKGDVEVGGVDNPGFVVDTPVPVVKQSAHQEATSGVFKGFHRLHKFSQDNFVILVSLLAVLMISLVILMIVLLTRHNSADSSLEDKGAFFPLTGDSDEQDKNKPVDLAIDPSTNITLPAKLKLVSRLEWLAQPPVEAAAKLQVPVPYIIISHTATENCTSQAQCIYHVRYIQTFHIESRGWWDIGYNFLVGGDGEAYEGRGWESEGAHTYGYNSKSIGISFIGTFNTFKPPERQINACKLLIEKGVKLGYVQKNYKLLAARQLQGTQSPGAAFYEEIKTWDHWAPKP